MNKRNKKRPILYWCLEKEDFPSMSDKEWEEFVDTCQDSFATACRDVGKDFLETWWEYGQPIPPPLKERELIHPPETVLSREQLESKREWLKEESKKSIKKVHFQREENGD